MTTVDAYKELTKLLENNSTEEVITYICNYFNADQLTNFVEFIEDEQE